MKWPERLSLLEKGDLILCNDSRNVIAPIRVSEPESWSHGGRIMARGVIGRETDGLFVAVGSPWNIFRGKFKYEVLS